MVYLPSARLKNPSCFSVMYSVPSRSNLLLGCWANVASSCLLKRIACGRFGRPSPTQSRRCVANEDERVDIRVLRLITFTFPHTLTQHNYVHYIYVYDGIMVRKRCVVYTRSRPRDSVVERHATTSSIITTHALPMSQWRKGRVWSAVWRWRICNWMVCFVV